MTSVELEALVVRVTMGIPSDKPTARFALNSLAKEMRELIALKNNLAYLSGAAKAVQEDIRKIQEGK